MKKILFAIILSLIFAIPACAEPAPTNKNIEHRFYEGCNIEQVKAACRKVFTSEPLKFDAPIATFSQKWEEVAESVMSDAPKIAFEYKGNIENRAWVGKFTQKDNGVDAYWIFGVEARSNYFANAFMFGVLAANIAAANGQQNARIEIQSATRFNKLYRNILERIEVALNLRDALPEPEKEKPEEPTEENQQE